MDLESGGYRVKKVDNGEDCAKVYLEDLLHMPNPVSRHLILLLLCVTASEYCPNNELDMILDPNDYLKCILTI